MDNHKFVALVNEADREWVCDFSGGSSIADCSTRCDKTFCVKRRVLLKLKNEAIKIMMGPGK